MTILEVKKMKQQLELRILGLVTEFHFETGARVTDLCLQLHETLDAEGRIDATVYNVSTRVEV